MRQTAAATAATEASAEPDSAGAGSGVSAGAGAGAGASADEGVRGRGASSCLAFLESLHGLILVWSAVWTTAVCACVQSGAIPSAQEALRNVQAQLR